MIRTNISNSRSHLCSLYFKDMIYLEETSNIKTRRLYFKMIHFILINNIPKILSMSYFYVFMCMLLVIVYYTKRPLENIKRITMMSWIKWNNIGCSLHILKSASMKCFYSNTLYNFQKIRSTYVSDIALTWKIDLFICFF